MNLHFPAPAGPVTNTLVGLAPLFASFFLASCLRAVMFSSIEMLLSSASFLASSAKVKMYDATKI